MTSDDALFRSYTTDGCPLEPFRWNKPHWTTAADRPIWPLSRTFSAPGGTRTPDPRIRSPNPYFPLTCGNVNLRLLRSQVRLSAVVRCCPQESVGMGPK